MRLSAEQRRLLHDALAGRPLAACFGAGVDSTAMLIALKLAGLRPDIITFADLRAENPPTLEHLVRMDQVLLEWSWPNITICRKETLPDTGYSDLYGNCMANETLPSLAFGLKSCSSKWKRIPQDQFIKGVKSGPNACPPHPIWMEAQQRGKRIVKVIGYDCGRADIRRSQNLPESDADFDYSYPLQILGWNRAECIHVISQTLGADMVPIKSACFFCPASKIWELYWLAAHHPELLERALVLERNALTGRHSRFTEVEFGASWEELVRSADRFPALIDARGCRWAISYQDAAAHRGDLYRFDGWVRVGTSRSGTDSRSGRRGRRKVIWGWCDDASEMRQRSPRSRPCRERHKPPDLHIEITVERQSDMFAVFQV